MDKLGSYSVSVFGVLPEPEGNLGLKDDKLDAHSLANWRSLMGGCVLFILQ